MAQINPLGVSLINPRKGIMDKDSQPSNIAEGNYDDALNVSSVAQGQNTQNSYMPCIGDTLAYTIPNATVQNKQYKVVIDCSNAVTGAIVKLFNTNLVQIGSDVTFNISTTPSTTNSNFETAINAQTTGYSLSISASTTSTTAILLITFTDVTGYEWTMTTLEPTITITLLKESIDASIAGEQFVIWSWQDFNNNVFLWSTTVNTLPTTMATVSSQSAGGKIQINVASTVGMVNGMSVMITDTISNEAVGKWIIGSITSTSFVLQHSTFSGSIGSTGTVTLFEEGYGQIGVATKNYNDGTWAYVRLIATKEWMWRTQYQITGDACIANNIWCLYWTNNKEVPRNMYYQGDFILDGGIQTTANSLSTYTYGNISNETTLIQSNDQMTIAFTGQTQGGGNVSSGNWRYFIRGLTKSLLYSNPTWISQCVPVYSSSQSPSVNVVGDVAGTPTNKVNNFLISNIIAGQFDYVELYGENFTGNGSVETFMITRIELPTNATTLVISHYGNETDTYQVDNATANIFNTSYSTAATLRLFRNRLALGNVTQFADIDFSVHAKSVTWDVNRKSLGAFGEYNEPNNVYNYMGYMHNETYCMGLQYHIINQGWTEAYFSGYVTINTTGHTLPNFDLTTSGLNGSEIPWIPYLVPTIPTNTMINGKPFNQVVDKIQIVRVDNIAGNFNEVLCTGVLYLGVFNTFNSQNLEFSVNSDNTGYPNPFSAAFNYASFYSPDQIWGNVSITPVGTDKLYNFGAPLSTINPNVNDGLSNNDSIYIENNGFTNGRTDGGFQQNAVTTGVFISRGGNAMLNAIQYNKTSPSGSYVNPASLAFYCSVAFTNPSGYTDEGIRYVQYFRAKKGSPNKFGDVTKLKYIITGATIDITPTTNGNVTTNVFGGDTFTQYSFFKNQYTTDAIVNERSGAGMMFYSQNYCNSQLRVGNTAIPNTFPSISGGKWLEDINPEFIEYNFGYTPQNFVQTIPAFNPLNPTISKLGTRIPYSNDRPNDSLVDNLRFFPPLQFRDLDETDGDIQNILTQGNDLYAYQKQKTSQLYFNSTGRLNVTDAAEIVEGNSGVMATPPKQISILGMTSRFGYCQGVSDSGEKTTYWFNQKNSKMMRFSGDGIRPISDEFFMSQFFRDNTTFIKNSDTPAAGQGMHFWFDSGRKEVNIVSRAWKQGIQAWTSGGGKSYNKGEIVSSGHYSIYNDIPQFYISLQGNNAGNTPISSPTWWQPIDISNNAYYNCWHLAFSELKHGFVTFYSTLPKIAIEFDNGHLLPMPVTGDNGIIFEQWVQNGNNYNQFWGGALVANGYISFAVNHSPSILKRFLALMINCDIQPYKVSVTTENQYTFMLNTDTWYNSFQKWTVAVAQDVNSGNGLNQGTGQDIFGNYAFVTFYFQPGKYQILQDLFMRSNPSAPLP